MRILLQADGGVGIGLGHASRCSALALALRRLGHEAIVIAHSATGLQAYFEQRGTPMVAVEASVAAILSYAHLIGANVLVLDSYQWTSEDYATLRAAGQCVVAFGDDARREMPVDALINGAPAAENLCYQTAASTVSWLGAAYQVVREEFRQVPARKSAGDVRHVLVMAGGDDPLGLLGPIASTLELLSLQLARPFRIQLICGPFAPVPDIGRYSQVEMHQHPSNLAELMQQADLAISAGGQTLYELARCGAPTIAFCSGADQENNLRALEALGVIRNTGDAKAQNWLTNLAQAVQDLVANPALRNEMALRAQQLIDGRGADRLAQEIVSLVVDRQNASKKQVASGAATEFP
jgi:UDP-2,4-diacetamido-2,4,6-trideoxy-beta-L-altropyranose hydrolase